MDKLATGLCIVIVSFFTLPYANLSAETVDECTLRKFKQSTAPVTETAIKTACEAELLEKASGESPEPGAITKRIRQERETQYSRHVITPHKGNYIMPVTYTDNLNTEVYEDAGIDTSELEDWEAKFQLSLKVPLNYKPIFTEGDGLYFGFTLQSWWQVYADGASAPFRETNYQPEIFYIMPLGLHVFNGNSGLIIGFEHQSNGRSQPISRSWNRLYMSYLFEKDNFALSFRPWYRIPEDEKDNPNDSDGDDNPDIDDYMGYFELRAAYRYRDYELTFMGRNNLRSDNHGAAEFSISFPLWDRLQGYAQYFNGYGESLVDYNHSQERFGIGILLTGSL